MFELPEFQPVSAVSEATIEKYRGLLPDQVLEIWRGQGFGTAANGFLKVIDPDRYTELLAGCFPRPGMIPVFATGLADLVVYFENRFVGLKYRYNSVEAFGSSLDFWPEDLVDLAADSLLESEFEWQPYPAAVERYGPLGYDECFGFVPILALGGPEHVDSLEKLRIFEHIQVITQLAGPIEY